MKSIFLLPVLFILALTNVFASDISTLVQGRVIEKVSDKPLAYVNIGVVGKGVGTVSNSKGEFNLNIATRYDQDMIRISMIGYKAQEYVVKDFKKMISENYNIFLEPITEVIKEIAIVDSKMKSYVKGNKSTVQNFTVGSESDTLGNEFATKFKIRKRKTILKNIRLSIVENSFDTLRFRLNIYDVKGGRPGAIINTKNIIIFTTRQGSDLLTVDLLPYDIIVNKNFFVSLEWIDNSGEGDVKFSAAFPAREVHFRSTSHAKWKSIKGLGIGMQVTILQ